MGRTYAGIAAALLACIAWEAHAQDAPDPLVAAGRRLYEEGVLASGEPLTGTRSNGLTSRGKAAACMSCHQRSGFGHGEGGNFVPPITADALFTQVRAPIEEPRTAGSVKMLPPQDQVRPGYDDASLAKAVRTGVGSGGQPLQVLMPRYALGDADMRALTAYLRTLSAAASPGHSAAGTRFATIIAPGQSPERRKQLIDVLNGCFNDRGGASVRDPWMLDVWDLEGPPETWGQQLAQLYDRAPVFAVISGLGGAEWAPVHAFCTEMRLPCLFPNVDAPGGPVEGGTTFYLSKGVVLEAEAGVRHLADLPHTERPRRIVQVVGHSEAAQKAARAATDAAGRAGLAIETRAFAEGAGQSLAGIAALDALLLWLAAEDAATVSREKVPAAATILASGWLAGFETIPLSDAWKRKALVIMPVDAPVRRGLRVRYNLAPWLERMGLATGDTMLQGNTLAACKIMTESFWRMRGHFLRDYLVEWVENYPTAMGNAPAPQAYPRFVISPGQRVSSHGVFLVRFKKQNPRELELARDWFVP
jgi:cytochrome c553